MTGKKTLVGVGSIYHSMFEGRRTANGEIFRQNRFTGASNNFPLGSTVEVTNLKNGCSVIIRVNDRMAISSQMKGRIIDLSVSSAKAISFYDGLTKVTVKQV